MVRIYLDDFQMIGSLVKYVDGESFADALHRILNPPNKAKADVDSEGGEKR